MSYKTYAEAKIANPDCEIFCSIGGNFAGIEHVSLVALSGVKEGWNKCNPADHCSTMKEFLDAGLKLVKGDKFIGVGGYVVSVQHVINSNKPEDEDAKRYILSAAALNGGCKIPAKSEPWTVYNNTLPLSDLSDDQAAQLFNSWRSNGSIMCRHYTDEVFVDIKDARWVDNFVYRIKQKSERELFIQNTTKVMRDAGTKCPDNHEYFGIMFDAGARYADLTQHFGENI